MARSRSSCSLLAMVRIGNAALDRAYRLAGLVVVEPDALGAELGVDDVNLVTLADGFVGALGLAGPAVDAVGRDVVAMAAGDRT